MPLPKNERIIYNKQFTRVNSEKIHAEENSFDTEIEKLLDSEIEALWKHIAENSVYKANPKKIADRQEFINTAIMLSTEYEISMAIKEHLYYIEVTMYWDCCACTGGMKEMIAELVSKCDCISSFIPRNRQCDIILSLDYYTHDHYVSGRKVDYM